MVTLTDRQTNRQGEYSAICLFEVWKIEGRDLQFCALHLSNCSAVLKVVFMTRLGGNRPAGIQATK